MPEETNLDADLLRFNRLFYNIPYIDPFSETPSPSIAPSPEAIEQVIEDIASNPGPPSPRIVVHPDILREVIDAL